MNRPSGFTLIELLTVIAVMAILAAFVVAVLGGLQKKAKISAATAELAQIGMALDNYHSQYNVYPPGSTNALVNQLYYELEGVTNVGGANGLSGNYETLDGASTVPVATYTSTFVVGGALNCMKQGGDTEAAKARDFLPALKANRIFTGTGAGMLPNGINVLVTSVAGPDASYNPLGIPQGTPGTPPYPNPFRYVYPGTNNPSSYDLWVQLEISHKTYLICNWSKNPIINSPLP